MANLLSCGATVDPRDLAGSADFENNGAVLAFFAVLDFLFEAKIPQAVGLSEKGIDASVLSCFDIGPCLTGVINGVHSLENCVDPSIVGISLK